MPDWLIACLAMYGVVTALIILFAGIELSFTTKGWDTRERKTLARIMLASPVWLPFGIVYGIYRLIQIARTGE